MSSGFEVQIPTTNCVSGERGALQGGSGGELHGEAMWVDCRPLLAAGQRGLCVRIDPRHWCPEDRT